MNNFDISKNETKYTLYIMTVICKSLVTTTFAWY